VAIDPGWTEDPKNDDDFWTIIEEMLSMAEYVLLEHRVETREEAVTGTLRLRHGTTFRDPLAAFIRYRGVDKDVDSRDYFLELGRKFLPKVARQIKARRLTPKFARNWGVVMTCHGFISAHILDDSDGLSHLRAGRKSAEKRNKDAQRKYVSRLLLHWIDRGHKRKGAEGQVERHIQDILDRGAFPDGFDEGWFKSILREGALAATYDQKHLPLGRLRELAKQPRNDLPPPEYFPHK
jgi:hypothetical protein